jgi:hypothetical protein
VGVASLGARVITVDVSEHGPVFDGRAQAAVSAFLREAVEEVSRTGKNMVLARLGAVLRDPTPYYETRIRYEMAGAYLGRINDGPSTFIYGPWLEGTGSRNATTRFKGYHTFRIICAELNAGRAQAVAERVLVGYLARMR